MKKVLCFVSDEMADFEVTLAVHLIKSWGSREIVPIGYDLTPVVSQAGFLYLPRQSLAQVEGIADVEALIIPGGPIRPQQDALTQLILRIHQEQKLLAAICFGPQYLGRAGILDHHRYTTSCSEGTIRALQVSDPFPRNNYVEERVVRDRNVITAKGTAFVDFAFAILETLEISSERKDEKERLHNDITGR